MMNPNGSAPARILVVDDVPVNIRLLIDTLNEQNYEVRIAKSGPAALAAIEAEQPDLVLLDVQMPTMNGFQVCCRLKELEETKDIPIIFISALDEIFDKVKAFQVGGIDYITKPFQQEEVVARVNTHLTLRRLQLDLERKNEELIAMANTDPLTGISNRRFFFSLADRELAITTRSTQPLAILMFDVDHFKKVNDTHGHLAGDQVLIKISSLISATLRKSDVFARYGGEEFVILMPNTSEKDAANLSERVRNLIASEPIAAEEKAIPVTISLGLATFLPDDQTSLVLLIDQADQALYIAKHDGRNRLVIWPME